jgi:hypothetical protein
MQYKGQAELLGSGAGTAIAEFARLTLEVFRKAILAGVDLQQAPARIHNPSTEIYPGFDPPQY